uniref:Uncharacterized protein n=1 Tax=Candidatus Kentrum sp. TUN TaxID=2126343 RepID=A0A450ZZ49_9GAMM|nr:MAG: hypothetical protein BECKTUN1418D_GA0071000_10947 [Candidatus Kentron sp. TUN]
MPFILCMFSSPIVSVITFIIALEFLMGKGLYSPAILIDVAIYGIGVLLLVVFVIHLGGQIIEPYRQELSHSST